MRDLAERIGYQFDDPELFGQVFSHRSFRHENQDDPACDNERLEFLGDAVLGFVVSRMLYDRFPDHREGELSRLRAHVVSARHLAGKARKLDLGSHLRLGRGEEMSGGRDKDSILADAYESLIAGILVDGGFEQARSFVQREFEDELGDLEARWPLRDFKSRLQEELHVHRGTEPSYRVAAERGPDHRKLFEVEVTVDGEVVAAGSGSSKKAAQQAAAREALAKLGLAPSRRESRAMEGRG